MNDIILRGGDLLVWSVFMIVNGSFILCCYCDVLVFVVVLVGR